MISVQFTWIGNDWLRMERHWLPFKAYQKRLSLQTPRISLLQFSFHILRKNYSRADEFVHAILLVIFDPIAITPAVVHGILTKISSHLLCTRQVWIYSTENSFCGCHSPGCLDSHKAFFSVWNRTEIRWQLEMNEDNEKHCAKFLSKLNSLSTYLWW